MRYTGVALGILVFAIVFMMCGEAGCSMCPHACCVNSDRPVGHRTIVSRILAACSMSVSRWTCLSSTTLALLPPSAAPPPTLFVEQVSPLRI